MRNGRPLTIWDMHVGKSEQTVRESVRLVGSAWVLGSVSGVIFWWVRSVQKHGEINEYDLEVKLPAVVAVISLIAVILVYLYWRNVLPAARRQLAELQQDAKSPDKRSSTKPPSC